MKRWLVFFASLGFGALFLWSGVAKVKDPVSFAEAIRNFRLVGDPIAPALAHFIPWLEIFAGAAVMWDRTRQGASVVLTLLLLGLTGAVVIAWIRGLDIACGCFGGEESIDYPVKVAQNFGLILWGVAIFFLSRRSRIATDSPPRP